MSKSRPVQQSMMGPNTVLMTQLWLSYNQLVYLRNLVEADSGVNMEAPEIEWDTLNDELASGLIAIEEVK